MKPGIYTVEAKEPDYKNKTRKIRVFQGQYLELAFIIDKPGRRFTITSDPVGADVYIDDVYSGETPLELKEVGPDAALSVKSAKKGIRSGEGQYQ